MKTTCNRCKAMYFGQYEIKCDLGYKIDYKKGVPLEDCPKPLTYKALQEASANRYVKENL